MLQWLLDLGTRYGYTVVFVGVMIESMGIPVPGETALLVGAVLAATGHLNIALVALAGWSGAVIGDNIGYWVGRKFSHRLTTLPLLRRIYTPSNLEHAEKFFAKRGWLAVFFGRFIALLRILAGPLAGMHRMPWIRFLIANALGGACWVAAVCAVGLLVGDHLDEAEEILQRSGYAGLAALVVGGVLWIVFSWRRHQRHRAV